MLEACWTVKFSSDRGIGGSGVFIVDNGQVYGGDSMFFYRGKIDVDRDTVRAHLKITQHSKVAGMVSAAGIPEFTIEATGQKNDQTMTLTGTASNGVKMNFKVERRAEL